MAGTLSFRTVLVGASLAVLAAAQVASAQADRFAALATDCNEEAIQVLREPSGLTDTDLSIRVSVQEADDIATAACARAAATEACKSIGFTSAVQLAQTDNVVEGQCELTPLFANLASDCNEESIQVLRQPSSVNDADRSVQVSVQERDDVTTAACSRAAAQEVCTSIGFSSAVQISQNGNVVDAQCAP